MKSEFKYLILLLSLTSCVTYRVDYGSCQSMGGNFAYGVQNRVYLDCPLDLNSPNIGDRIEFHDTTYGDCEGILKKIDNNMALVDSLKCTNSSTVPPNSGFWTPFYNLKIKEKHNYPNRDATR